MVVEFRWEDLFTGHVRRRKRVEAEDPNHYAEFLLPDLAPTENLRVILLDSAEHGMVLAEILFKR